MGFLIGLAALGGVVLAVGLSRHRIEPAEPVAPRCVEEFALRDARGQLHELKQWQAHRAVLLFVLGTECPVSNGYAPEMRRIAATYAPRGVATFGVHPDPEVSAEVAARHAAEYGLDFPVLLDPAQELVGAAGVRVTPEAVVLDPKGRVLYHGRIDDRVAPDGKRRDRPRTLDVEIALEAVLAGGVPPVAEVPAFGCPLPEPAPLLDEGETITVNKHVAPILWKHC
ncbi:MAG: redoxin domain-containing protein, partial [Isosphaeraceae bacterium]|nr:redoxin domain-containing protein [Isosphaeraceae bacterium]